VFVALNAAASKIVVLMKSVTMVNASKLNAVKMLIAKVTLFVAMVNGMCPERGNFHSFGSTVRLVLLTMMWKTTNS